MAQRTQQQKEDLLRMLRASLQLPSLSPLSGKPLMTVTSGVISGVLTLEHPCKCNSSTAVAFTRLNHLPSISCQCAADGSAIAVDEATNSITEQLTATGLTAEWQQGRLKVSPVLTLLEKQHLQEQLSGEPGLAGTLEQRLTAVGQTSGLLLASMGTRPKTASSITWCAKQQRRKHHRHAGKVRKLQSSNERVCTVLRHSTHALLMPANV